MGEGKPSSTPGTSETYDGSATETHGANTNLDPNMQGGPSTAADRSATEEVVHQNSEQGVPTASTRCPTRPNRWITVGCCARPARATAPASSGRAATAATRAERS